METVRTSQLNGMDVGHECLCRGVTSRTATHTTSRVTADSVKERTALGTAVQPMCRYNFTSSGYSALRLMNISNQSLQKTPRLSKTHSRSQRQTHPQYLLQSLPGRPNRLVAEGGRKTVSLACVSEAHSETQTARDSTTIGKTSTGVSKSHQPNTWTLDPSAGAACDSRDIVPLLGSPEVILETCFSCRRYQHAKYLLTKM